MKELTDDEVSLSCRELRKVLYESVEKNAAYALLLSGGLDTSILAAIYKGRIKKAFTIAMVHNETPAPDLEYAIKIAKKFDYEHHIIHITEEEALEKIPEVIKALRTFDPAIPNDLAIYFGLREAKNQGIKSVMTGDAADELFAGYSYMHDLSEEKLDKYIKNLSKTMFFSSNKLGDFLGVGIKQPYRDTKMVSFAVNLSPRLKVKRIGDKIWGKWLLRKAFEDELKEIIWREKTPIEYGSGTTKLREVIKRKIPDKEFMAKKRKYGMEFINKEHLFFYEIYRDVVGEIPKGEKNKCPFCETELENRFHCSTCGFALPIQEVLSFSGFGSAHYF